MLVVPSQATGSQAGTRSGVRDLCISETIRKQAWFRSKKKGTQAWFCFLSKDPAGQSGICLESSCSEHVLSEVSCQQ